MSIFVIGGGPAGMLAAIAAAEAGGNVTIVDRNEKFGKKLFISGKGRCNLTNNADISDHFACIARNANFLYSALYSFDNVALMSFFEENKLALKVERGGRVFPQSDKSSDVIRVLTRKIEKLNISQMLNSKAESIIENDGKVSAVLIDGKEYQADAVILACGGMSYPLTGSTGDGYKMAEELGHRISDILPALIPLETKEDWPRKLQGLTLKNVVLSAYQDKSGNENKKKAARKPVFKELGELLFTHFGVSGPLILSASSRLDPLKGDISLSIDLKPALSIEQIDARILREFQAQNRKQFINAVHSLLPARMLEVIVNLSGIAAETPVSRISREERLSFAALLKNLSFNVSAFRPISEAIVTRGGINVKEVNPSSMQSKLLQGLFFAGEILDVDALTGGFNLQIAFSTGHLAGVSAANYALN